MIHDRTENTLSEFTDDTKLGRVADAPDWCAGSSQPAAEMDQEFHEAQHREIPSPDHEEE